MTRTIVYLLRKMFIFFARVLLSFYYREVQVIGIENIPKDGPVIIIANHPNMYLDTLYIPAYLPRHISYLVSASTHRQRLMGFVSKIFGNIPVERPRDISQEGIGQVELFPGGIVKGYSTKFTKQASVGGVLLIKFKIFFEYTILEIKSDTEMTIKIKDEHLFQFNQIKDYKVAPKFEQGHVIEEAKEILGNGECLGVFPEGWSHDLTELLPLKAGVAMIGLGAMLKDKDMKINVVWCGFKYTRQSRFRSRAVVEYGCPFEIDESLVREYELDKRQAWENFLKIVELNLRKVIFSTPSYAEMNSLHLVKRLYIPTSISQNLSIEENNEIHKRLIEGYNKFNDKQEIKELIGEVSEYGKDLKNIWSKGFSMIWSKYEQVLSCKENFSFKSKYHNINNIPFARNDSIWASIFISTSCRRKCKKNRQEVFNKQCWCRSCCIEENVELLYILSTNMFLLSYPHLCFANTVYKSVNAWDNY